MNLDGIKAYVKSKPQLECLYMCFKSLGSPDECKKIIGVKRNPYNIIVNHNGSLHENDWIYFINFNGAYSYNGFCSLFRLALLHIAYAEDLKMTPVIFWGNKTLYYDSSIISTDNVFEYYFQPISEIPVSDVASSYRVTVSKGLDASAFGTVNSYQIPDSDINVIGDILKRYISLKPEIKDIFWKDLEIYTEGGKTLGVHVRSTDYNVGYNRHPVVVTTQEYISYVKDAIENHGFERIFLATDDADVIEVFEKEFGSRLCYYKDSYRSKEGKAIHYGSVSDRKSHKFLLGLEMIKDVYTLGHCSGLIAGVSNVSLCARGIKKSTEEDYDFIRIIDKGVNHNMKETRSVFGHMLKR